MSTSSIEWTEHTWNPIVGCSLASPGCTNCYAMKMAYRLGHMGQPHYQGLTQKTKAGAVWTGKLAFNENALLAPLKRKKPTTYFVNSMGDLFHEDVPDEWIDRIFAVMALCPQHIFQVLTKRSDRMREYLTSLEARGDVFAEIADHICDIRGIEEHPWVLEPADFPLPNVWLGVSVEDQTRADERIPDLLATPAAVRFLSCEPLLGPVNLDYFPVFGPDRERLLHWVIAGGESGPGARGSTDEVEANMRALRDQCKTAGVAFFGKQNFQKRALPDDLMVREMPTPSTKEGA